MDLRNKREEVMAKPVQKRGPRIPWDIIVREGTAALFTKDEYKAHPYVVFQNAKEKKTPIPIPADGVPFFEPDEPLALPLDEYFAEEKK